MSTNPVKRVAVYTRKHILRDPKYFFTYCFRYFDNRYIPKIKYYEYEDLYELLNQKKNIIRLGDGDLYTLTGGGQPYQPYSKELQNKLFTLITEYDNSSDYILCLNKRPLEKSNLELKKLNLINCWLPSKVYFDLYFNKTALYHDAAMFYYLDTLPKYFENYLCDKLIIIATNADNIGKLKLNNSIPFKNISYVVTPKIDAFSEYETIVNDIMKIISSEDERECVVLAAFGPASKVLALDFGKRAHVIDIGHGIEIAYSDKGMDEALP